MATYKMVKKDDKYYYFSGALKEFQICCIDVYNVIWSLTNIVFYDKNGQKMKLENFIIKDTYNASFTLNGKKVNLEVKGTYYKDQWATYSLSYFVSSSTYQCCMLNEHGDDYGFFFTCDEPIKISKIEFNTHLTVNTCCPKEVELRFKGTAISRFFTSDKVIGDKIILELFKTPKTLEEQV